MKKFYLVKDLLVYTISLNSMKLVLLLILFNVLFALATYGNVYPIFPNGENNISIAARILFQSQYPINTNKLIASSPYFFDATNNILNSNVNFYVVPNEYLQKIDLSSYSMPAKIVIGDSNMITILPEKPFEYNTKYSVVFKNFPVLIPDISATNGYHEETIDAVFPSYFTTIEFPTIISDISFQKTGNKLLVRQRKNCY